MTGTSPNSASNTHQGHLLITGSNGLLGQKLLAALRQKEWAHVKVLATSLGTDRSPLGPETNYLYRPLDVTDPKAVAVLFKEFNISGVIHTAAMTNVDACEGRPEECHLLNVEATRILAEQCKSAGAHLVHLSTDFVFDGEAGPYRETDTPNPLSVYGLSKLRSEEAVQKSGCSYSILRTIIVYGFAPGLSRSNIVLWALESLRQNKELNVVTDQVRMPTLAEDLAAACLSAWQKKAQGLFHVSGPDMMDMYSLVCTVGRFFGLRVDLVHPTTGAGFKQPAPRPAITGFVLDKARQELDYSPQSFEQGLTMIRDQLQQAKVL